MSNSLIEFEASPIKDLNKFLEGVPESNKLQYALTTHLIKEYPDSLRAELSGVRVNENHPSLPPLVITKAIRRIILSAAILSV